MAARGHALVVGIDAYPGFGPEAQLRGAVRDARVFAELLRERWGFAAIDVLHRLRGDATRKGILGAFETLARRVRRGDRVVVFFSGHGSQMTDREGDEGDGLDETLVPVDSGRGERENRDITDDEIHLWSSRILAVTPHLVLVFDCCHAATLHRPEWRVRSVPADRRPAHLLPPSPLPPDREVDPGPAPLVLAACGDHQLAYELPPRLAGVDRGLFSYHLERALRDVPAGGPESWRAIFERARAGMRRHCRDQAPVISGEAAHLPPFDRRLGYRGDPESRRGVAVESGAAVASRLLSTAAAAPPGWRLDLYRSRRGPWCVAEDFRPGDRLRVDVRHVAREPLFVYLLDIGVAARPRLIFPEPDGHEALDPGLTLTVGDRREGALKLFWPAGEAPDRDVVTCHLLLLASRRRLASLRLLDARFAVHGDGGPVVVSRAYRLRRR